MTRLLPLFLLLTACEVTAPRSTDCVEFDRNTLHNGKPVTCRMIWCDSYSPRAHNASGLATLWCDEREAGR